MFLLAGIFNTSATAMMKPVAVSAAKQLGHCPTGLVAFAMQDLKVTMPGPAATLKEPEKRF